MQASKSDQILLESVPLKDLFKRDPGSLGLYIPVVDEAGSTQASITRISSHAKSLACRNAKRCEIRTLLIMQNEQERERPVPLSMLQITVRSVRDMSSQGR